MLTKSLCRDAHLMSIASFCISSLEPLQVEMWSVAKPGGMFSGSTPIGRGSGERGARTSTARCRPHDRCGMFGHGWSCTRGCSRLSSLSSLPCLRMRNRCRRRDLAVPHLSATSLSARQTWHATELITPTCPASSVQWVGGSKPVSSPALPDEAPAAAPASSPAASPAA